MERRVVVWVTHWRRSRRRRKVIDFDPYSSLPAMTRCTTQLIIVNSPWSLDTDSDSSDSTHHTHTPHSTDHEDETTEDI